jgi:phosphohistidine phosphatase
MGAGPLRLVVMRHAKTGELPGGPDFERALTGRGHRDAAAAGRWLRDSGLAPDAVLCSPARRTRQTWLAVQAELGREVTCDLDDIMYTARTPAIAEIIAATPPAVTTLLCVGHNPAMAELAAQATGQPLEFPTAAIAVALLPGPWAAVADDGPGDLGPYWTPKLGAGGG